MYPRAPTPGSIALAAALALPSGGCTLLFPMGDFDSGEASGFAERCADPSVVRCVGFDSQAEMKTLYAHEPCAEIDTEVLASGGGSLRASVAKNGSAQMCAVNFQPGSPTDPPALDATSFGPGETFFVQWRMRYDAAALTADYGGENARDQLFIGPGDEGGNIGDWAAKFALVVGSLDQRGLPTVRLGGPEVSPMTGTSDFMLQNRVDGCTLQHQERCKRLVADAWMTFQVALTVGHDGEADTRVRAWLGVGDEASVPLVDVDGLTINGDGMTPLGYGKLWLWPKVEAPGSLEASEGHVWYDDVIVSRAFVADP